MSLQLAEQFEANEQYEEAYKEYKKEFEQNPNNMGVLERLGHLSLILQKPDEAAVYYNEILKRDITNQLAYEQLMNIYESTDKYKYYIYRGNRNSIEGKLEFAINDFKKAISVAEEATQVAMTRFTLANLYMQSGNPMKAIDEFNILLEGPEVHEEMFLQLADLYLKDEAYSSAIDTLNRAKQRGFDTPKVNEGIAAVYLKSGNPAKAMEYTKDELLKIQCMLELGQVDEAYGILNELPEELKQSPRYYTLRAQYFYSAKKFDEALNAVDEYDKMNPNSPLTYQMKALIFEEQGDDYQAHVYWGKYNVLRKNNDVAINEFLNAVAIKDDDVDLLFELAQLLTDNKEIDHASEYYEKIVKINPANKEALRKLASYREGIGDYVSQVKYLEKIVEADSRDLSALKELARAYEKSHSKGKAVEVYKKCLELTGDTNEYALLKDKIDKLESLGASDVEESEGLLDKIMKLFNK